nr:immunoglobulin light chain junction region [Macaca mulatta]MOV74258.1 immunoglobulin light chain junction region [Macaca mulatta]MOV74276.1 immunoglobulin light chain junction region [Macaca mulatta]MOV74315.1 immunoglobulin light chain junction region [Macaca mulatta]MOV74364.1 immunoglobulin light chain junction region [Macaca mulatta]
CQQLDNSPYSF